MILSSIVIYSLVDVAFHKEIVCLWLPLLFLGMEVRHAEDTEDNDKGV